MEKSASFGQMRTRVAAGTAGARLWGARFVAPLAPALMSCLVPTDVDVPAPPSCPPSIEAPDTSPSPLDRVRRVVADTTDPVEVPFQVVVRDCNENQELLWLVVLNHRPDLNMMREVVRSGRLAVGERGSFQFSLDTGDLDRDACNKVELRVSSAFSGINVGEPITAGDLGTAVWYLNVVTNAAATVPLGECP